MSNEIQKAERTDISVASEDLSKAFAAFLAKIEPSLLLNFRGKPFCGVNVTDRFLTECRKKGGLVADWQVMRETRIPAVGYERVDLDGDVWWRYSWLVIVEIRVTHSVTGQEIGTMQAVGMACSDEWQGREINPKGCVTTPDNSVINKAVSRARRNATASLFGLKSLTWDMIEKAGGSRAKATQLADDAPLPDDIVEPA